MQINKAEEKPKREQDNRTIRDKLFDEFEKLPDAYVTLAYMYARGYQMCDTDITKAWTNAVQNNQIVETAYRRGYEDAVKDIEQKRRRDFYHKVVYDLKKDW